MRELKEEALLMDGSSVVQDAPSESHEWNRERLLDFLMDCSEEDHPSVCYLHDLYGRRARRLMFIEGIQSEDLRPAA